MHSRTRPVSTKVHIVGALKGNIHLLLWSSSSGVADAHLTQPGAVSWQRRVSPQSPESAGRLPSV